MFKFNRENKTALADTIDFGGQRVQVPKLTIKKWRMLLDNIQTLPQIFIDVLMARGSSDFTATVTAALSVALDEIIELVSVLTELDKEWIEENVDHNELLNYVEKTVQKNDFAEAGKKFRAVFGSMIPSAAFRSPSPSMNGSSNVPSNSE